MARLRQPMRQTIRPIILLAAALLVVAVFVTTVVAPVALAHNGEVRPIAPVPLKGESR